MGNRWNHKYINPKKISHTYNNNKSTNTKQSTLSGFNSKSTPISAIFPQHRYLSSIRNIQPNQTTRALKQRYIQQNTTTTITPITIAIQTITTTLTIIIIIITPTITTTQTTTEMPMPTTIGCCVLEPRRLHKRPQQHKQQQHQQ